MATSAQLPDHGRPAPAWGAGLTLAGLLWWVSDVVVIALRVPLESPALRAQVFLADGAAIAAALGFTALLAWLIAQLPRPARGLAAVATLTLVFGVALLPDLTPFFERRSLATHLGVEPLVGVTAAALAATLLFGVRGALWISSRGPRDPRMSIPRGSRSSRTDRAIAALCLLSGAAAFAANSLILRGDYPGIHLTIAAAASALVTVAGVLGIPGRGRWSQRSTPLVAGSVALIGLALALREPPARVQLALARCEGAALSPFLGRLRPRPTVDAALAGSRDLWFSTTRPTRPATDPPLLEGVAPVVVLVTVDALRADLLRDRAALPLPSLLPNLAALRGDAVDFTAARANGTQTVSSLATLFAGTYFSQQYWSRGAPPGTRASTGLFPHADPTPRFPELLQAAGVRTVNLASATWLVNSVGIVRGFTEEEVIETPGENFAHARDLTDAALTHLADPGPRPLFLYLHYLDPHIPYDRGEPLPAGARGPYAHYLAEVALVDRELGRVIDRLRAPDLAGRAVLIVSADHGEAFGEHGTTQHAVSLYDELLRVPLLVVGPDGRFAPREVETPVALVDLGPTILDLFDLPAPGETMGQSLGPLLRGDDAPPLTRPIIAEGRLKKSWVFDDGLKLIVDDRLSTVELYDLLRDPAELTNLADDPKVTAPRLATLRHFFAVHTIQRPGYRVPFRR